MLQTIQRPLAIFQRPLPFADNIEIYWWRLVFHSLRLLTWSKHRAAPLVVPVLAYLWVPAAALLFGILLGWAIAAG
jgi:hypothetical protein